MTDGECALATIFHDVVYDNNKGTEENSFIRYNRDSFIHMTMPREIRKVQKV